MIRIDALSKVYGARARTVRALDDVTLELGPGVWGVVGPNGAGKTTLLGAILGFLRPTSGTVRIDGERPARFLRREGAAYLPERFRLPGEWPVRAALRGLARLDGHAGPAADDRAETALRRLGLEEHADRPVGTLSRGLTQRVGLAQALLGDRRLVVLDEPTEGLDPLWRVRFRELVRELDTGDRVILLSSHDLAEVERLAGRVVVLRDGRVREVMATGAGDDGPFRYDLAVSDIDPADLAAAFPGARPEGGEADGTTGGDREAGGGAAPGPGAKARVVAVEVSDPRELSHRLAALLDAGATVHAVTPRDRDLESRVRERLEDGA